MPVQAGILGSCHFRDGHSVSVQVSGEDLGGLEGGTWT